MGTGFQGRNADGIYECRYVFVLDWVTWTWNLCPLGTAVSGLEQTFSGVYVDKTVHDFVHHADLVLRSAGLQVF